MWTATYTNIDNSGLNPELNVRVLFSNDQNDVTYENLYYVLPTDLNSTFPDLIQTQIDILNSKDDLPDTKTLLAQPVSKIKMF